MIYEIVASRRNGHKGYLCSTRSKLKYTLKVLYCKLFYSDVSITVTYLCDPNKNTECTKEMCHVHGGPCIYTTDKKCSKEKQQ